MALAYICYVYKRRQRTTTKSPIEMTRGNLWGNEFEKWGGGVKKIKLYHCSAYPVPRVGVRTGQSISSRLSSNPSFFRPLRLLINIVGLRPKASPG